jgi:hypothetical protein
MRKCREVTRRGAGKCRWPKAWRLVRERREAKRNQPARGGRGWCLLRFGAGGSWL